MDSWWHLWQPLRVPPSSHTRGLSNPEPGGRKSCCLLLVFISAGWRSGRANSFPIGPRGEMPNYTPCFWFPSGRLAPGPELRSPPNLQRHRLLESLSHRPSPTMHAHTRARTACTPPPPTLTDNGCRPQYNPTQYHHPETGMERVRKTWGDWRGTALHREAPGTLTKPVLNIRFTSTLHHCTDSFSLVSRPWFSYFFSLLLESLPCRKKLPSPLPAWYHPWEHSWLRLFPACIPCPLLLLLGETIQWKFRKYFIPLGKSDLNVLARKSLQKHLLPPTPSSSRRSQEMKADSTEQTPSKSKSTPQGLQWGPFCCINTQPQPIKWSWFNQITGLSSGLLAPRTPFTPKWLSTTSFPLVSADFTHMVSISLSQNG